MFVFISIICFAITFFILRNLYKDDWKVGDRQVRVKAKLWQWVLAFIICCIPIVNIVALVLVIAIWISNYREGICDYYLQSNITDKIMNFLNKEL